MKFLNDHVMDEVAKYRKGFDEAKPYRHLAIDNFFTPEAHAKFLEEFPGHGSTEGIVGDYGSKNAIKGGKSDLPDFGPTFNALDAYIQTDEFLGWIAAVSGVEDPLYDPTYNGAGIHENFSGNRNRVHIDYNYHPKFNWHRRLNAIIYITPDWDPAYGGALKVLEDGFKPGKGERKLVPCLANRCVLFETTEHSWHGVETIAVPEDQPDMTRKSISLYFYSEAREKVETANRHSTIYTPDMLPFKIKEGVTLSAEDAQALQQFQKGSLGLIKNLYGEHERLIGVIDKRTDRNKAQAARIQELTQKVRKLNGRDNAE